MGANQSLISTGSGETISMNRIRDVCQRNSTLPEELRNFRILLLANDLNGLGFKVPVRDSGGKPLSHDAICARIQQAIPPRVEDICMVSNGRRNNESIKKMVQLFNENYGANIVLKNYKGEVRDLTSICDDMYLVADKVNRGLNKDTKLVKDKLTEGIEDLKRQKKMLEALFNRHLGMLHQGDRYDSLLNDIKMVNGKQHGMLSEIDDEIRALSSQLVTLKEGYDTKVNANIGTLDKMLNDYASTAFLPAGTEEGLVRASKMMSIIPMLGVNTSTCVSCVNKVFGDMQQFEAAKASGNFGASLASRINTLVAKGDMTQEEITKCYSALNEGSCGRDSMSMVQQHGLVNPIINEELYSGHDSLAAARLLSAWVGRK